MKTIARICAFALVVVPLFFTACGPKWKEAQADGFTIVTQKGGATLGYNSAPILTANNGVNQ